MELLSVNPRANRTPASVIRGGTKDLMSAGEKQVPRLAQDNIRAIGLWKQAVGLSERP